MPGEPSAPAPPPAVPKLPTTLPFEDEAARGRRQGCLKWGLVGCAGASVVLIVLLLYALSNMRQLMGTLLEKAGDEVVASATADVTQVEKERFRAALAAFSQKAQKGAVKPETIDEWRKRATRTIGAGHVAPDEFRALTAWLEAHARPTSDAPPPKT